MKEEKDDENIKTKKSKKKVIIIVTVILVFLIIAGCVAGFLYYHGQQFALLHVELVNNLNKDIVQSDGTFNPNTEIDMEIKTKGNYAIVEKTMKDYLNEIITIGQGVNEICSEEKMAEIMSIENLKNDGPDFVETKQKIAQMKQQITEYINKMIELCNRDTMLSAIDGKGLNDFYKGVYESLIGDEEVWGDFESQIKELEKAKEDINLTFDYINNIIQYLSDNKSSWTIQNNQILFYSQQKLDKYNEIVNNAPTV